MQGPLALLASLPAFGAEVLFWLSVAVGVTLVHQLLNVTLAPKSQIAGKGQSRTY